MDGKQREAAEEPAGGEGQIGEGRLDVHGVDVRQPAPEDAPADEAEVHLVDVEDVEEERGAAQGDRGEEEAAGRPQEPRHYPTSSRMSTMAWAGASRAGSVPPRKCLKAR